MRIQAPNTAAVQPICLLCCGSYGPTPSQATEYYRFMIEEIPCHVWIRSEGVFLNCKSCYLVAAISRDIPASHTWGSVTDQSCTIDKHSSHTSIDIAMWCHSLGSWLGSQRDSSHFSHTSCKMSACFQYSAVVRVIPLAILYKDRQTDRGEYLW